MLISRGTSPIDSDGNEASEMSGRLWIRGGRHAGILSRSILTRSRIGGRSDFGRWGGAIGERLSGVAAADLALWRRSRGSDADAARDRWRDALWATLVGHADTVLRRCYGVVEFTDNPDCILRIELGQARSATSLPDGTQIGPGEQIGHIHFWNEHLPRFSSNGPDLRWAKAVRCRMQTSLRELADYVERVPSWQDVRAFHGCAPFSSRRRALRIQRVTCQYGFDLVDSAGAAQSRHAFGENLVLWALARAFNPLAVHRQPFLRERHELWISRQRLLERYAAGRAHPDGEEPGECSPGVRVV